MSNPTLGDQNSLENFLYALRAPESKRQYPRRLKVLFDYLFNKRELNSNLLEKQCEEFIIKSKEQISRSEIDPDHFTVYRFKKGWEGEMLKVWTQEELNFFKERQKLLSTIPLATRKRTKIDKSYREGWMDGIAWLQIRIDEILHRSEKNC